MDRSISRQIKRFLIRIILIIIIIFCCDLGIGTILRFFYFRQESGPYYRTTYAIDSTTAEILIFGSSRANHHYVPEVFENNLHCTFYNTGRDGNFILYNYAIFKSITKRYLPKMIIFDINPDEIEYTANSYDRLSSLLPYYHTHPEIRGTVDLRGPFEKIKLLSSIYPFNSVLLTLVKEILQNKKKTDSENKGYVPIFKKMKYEKIDTVKIVSEKINVCSDDNKTAALKDMIRICKQHKIILVFVQSPIFIVNHDSYYNSLFSEICKENQVSYFNLSAQTIFINHPDYFADYDHLNDNGAKVFSTIILGLLKTSFSFSGRQGK